tara:strand:+ start:1680 stop:1862 length:183 start_codon:yes stop_codon:yes gene_type:complete
MTPDEHKQSRIDDLLDRYFENEIRIQEVKLKLKAMKLPTSEIDDITNSARDAKRDIRKGR